MATTIPAPLAGKVALITGGSKGIGEAVALDFAKKGATHIALTYLSDAASAASVLAKLKSINPSITTAAFPADIREPEAGAAIVAQALRDLSVSRIDILVSNAGLKSPLGITPALDATKADFDEVMCADAWTPLRMAQAVHAVMPPGGRIVMCSSNSARHAYGDPIMLHGAAKAAMEALARNLAAAWGREKGITVNSISIGATMTESLHNTIKEVGEEVLKYATDASPLKRVAEPEEVAAIISFVASPEASWITGNCIPANGGSMSALQG